MLGEICCYRTLYPDADDTYNIRYAPLYAYNASADPDTLYLHEAMKEKYQSGLRIAMQKEINDMEGKKSVVHKAKVPNTVTFISVVCQINGHGISKLVLSKSTNPA